MRNNYGNEEDDFEYPGDKGDSEKGPMGLGGLPESGPSADFGGSVFADPGQGGSTDSGGLWDTPEDNGEHDNSIHMGGGRSQTPTQSTGPAMGGGAEPPPYVSTPKQSMTPTPQAGSGTNSFTGSAPSGFTSQPSSAPFRPKVLGQAMPLSGAGKLSSLTKGLGSGGSPISSMLGLLKQRKGLF